MNEEKKNQEYFQETFREVHASQELAERLMNMEELKNRKKAGLVSKWLVVAAVAAVALFAGSNGVAYAMTGSTWVEKIFTGPSAELVVKDDSVWIVDGDIVIDVTEELENSGQVSGTYETDECTKEYMVYIRNGQHHLDVKYHYEGTEEMDGLRPIQSGVVIAGTPTPAP